MLEVYPIGKAPLPDSFEPDAVRSAIHAIAQLPDELRGAVDGCRDIDNPIRDGAWTIRALVHHVADSHLNAYVRTKLALTENEPTVRPYDEVAWSELPDSRMDVAVSLALLTSLHRRWVELLSSLSPADLGRPWRPPAAELRPLWYLPLTYAWHGRHHTEQIRRAREFYGL